MATSPPPSIHINFRAILSKSTHIVRARPRHFLALFVFFLLPLSFSGTFTYQLFFPYTTVAQAQAQLISLFIFTLIFVLIMSIVFLLATGSITYSVFHGYYGRPVKLISPIKSAFTSFFRLFSTCLLIEIIILAILLVLGLILFSLVKATQVLNHRVNFSSSSPYFVALSLVFLIIFVSIVVYLQIIWMFAYVIIVVESSWGIEPLKRSKYLVTGLEGIAFKMFLFNAFFGGILTWFSVAVWNSRRASYQWKTFIFVIHIVITSTLIMELVLFNLAANTVFYIYSKAKHGELEGDNIAIEFTGEYVPNEKVPHFVFNV